MSPVCAPPWPKGTARGYIRLMYPMDGSDPRDFEGIDFAVRFNGPAPFDRKLIEGRILDALGDFFEKKGIIARKCMPSGLGATAGGPAPVFYDVLKWISENWSLLTGISSFVLGALTRPVSWFRSLKRKFDQKVLDPYKASTVVELGARARGDDSAAQARAEASFRTLLTLAPNIDELLRSEFEDQAFSLRFLLFGRPSDHSRTYAFFKVKEISPSDVSKMIRFLDRHKFHGGISAALLYRKFGKFTAIDASRKEGDFMRLMIR